MEQPEMKLRLWVAGRPNRQEGELLPSLAVEIVNPLDSALLVQTVTPLRRDGKRAIPTALQAHEGHLQDLLETAIETALEGYQTLSMEWDQLPGRPAWLETCIEWIRMGDRWVCRGHYVGGKFSLNGLPATSPVGVVRPDLLRAWSLLQQHLSALTATERLSAQVDPEQDAILHLDGHSGGILLHEALGHPAEADNPCSRWGCPPVRGLQVQDLPSAEWGPDYSTADDGQPGIPIMLGGAPVRPLDQASGNRFLGVKPEGAAFLIRQRNMKVTLLVPDSASSAMFDPNAAVLAGGISSTTGTMLLACGMTVGGRPQVIRLRIPPGAIADITGNGLPRFDNATICVKAGCSHVVGISCVGLQIRLREPISNFLMHEG